MTKRIGILGGTFNPIHLGHLYLANEFCARLSLSRVLLIPTWLPPHKQEDSLAPADMRLAMCNIAVRDAPKLAVSDIEIRRGGVSYTADTLLELDAPGVRHYLLMGSDMFLTVESWSRFEIIAKLADLCTTARGDDGEKQLEACARRLSSVYGARCHIESIPPITVSSTDVRSRIMDRGDVTGLLPAGVGEFIRENGLYR